MLEKRCADVTGEKRRKMPSHYTTKFEGGEVETLSPPRESQGQCPPWGTLRSRREGVDHDLHHGEEG